MENLIDALTQELLLEGKIDRLDSEIKKIDPKSLNGSERESWYHLKTRSIGNAEPAQVFSDSFRLMNLAIDLSHDG